MKKYEKTSFIDCTLEELFDFHLDVNNLKAITPDNIQITFLEENFTPKENGVLKIKTVKNLLPVKWEVKIEKLQRPNILVDLALKSPFKYWKHSHVFTKKGNMCELRDIVEYELPFGKLGVLFDFFIKKELDAMFTFRHNKTKKLLEK
ncbi:SRPBCC family protein [Halarcobacter sp.]|uniref:SRPBCC family protein n=1 Tax=Halarcobacter sp. TaxID=2321133 RepID=UPI003A941990